MRRLSTASDFATATRLDRASSSSIKLHDLVEALLGPALLVFAVAVKRHRAPRWLVWAEAPAVELDKQLLVEQAPPERHRLPGQLGLDFVGRALDRDGRVAGDAAALRLARKSAEPLARAHRAHAVGRQAPEPVLDPAVRLAAMVAVVVDDQRAAQPKVGFRLVLRFVEMVQHLVHLLDGAERPLDLAFRLRRRPALGLRRRHVGQYPHAEAAHHRLEHLRAADRAVVHIDRGRDALERQLGLGFRGHGIEQEAQRGLGLLAVDAAVFVVDDAGAVIDHREQHQGRLAAARLDAERSLNLLEVGRAHVELPKLVGPLGLEAHRCDRAGDARMVQARSTQHAIDGCALEQARRRPHQSVRRFNAVFFEEADRPRRREMAPLLVRGPDLERGDDFGVALHPGRGHRTGRSVVGAPHRLRPGQLAQRTIDRPHRNAVSLGRACDHLTTSRIARRQQGQAARYLVVRPPWRRQR